MSNEVINGIFSLSWVALTFLGTYILNRNSKKQERSKYYQKQYLEELRSFYNLEKLYINAIADLRKKLPDEDGSITELGIQREFRRKNEDNDNVPITMTEHNASVRLARLEN